MTKKQVVKSGFTLIEAALFLGIAGLLLLGIIVTTNGVISAQRYNDSVRGFSDFLKNQYANVLNVRSDRGNGGRDLYEVIYGQAIRFEQEGSNSKITTYQVTGKDSSNPNYKITTQNGSYTMLWGATVHDGKNTDIYKGTIAIVRSPSSGALNVYRVNDRNEFAQITNTLTFCIKSNDSSSTRAVQIDVNGQTSDAVTISEDDNLCN